MRNYVIDKKTLKNKNPSLAAQEGVLLKNGSPREWFAPPAAARSRRELVMDSFNRLFFVDIDN